MADFEINMIFSDKITIGYKYKLLFVSWLMSVVSWNYKALDNLKWIIINLKNEQNPIKLASWTFGKFGLLGKESKNEQ